MEFIECQQFFNFTNSQELWLEKILSCSPSTTAKSFPSINIFFLLQKSATIEAFPTDQHMQSEPHSFPSLWLCECVHWKIHIRHFSLHNFKDCQRISLKSWTVGKSSPLKAVGCFMIAKWMLICAEKRRGEVKKKVSTPSGCHTWSEELKSHDKDLNHRKKPKKNKRREKKEQRRVKWEKYKISYNFPTLSPHLSVNRVYLLYPPVFFWVSWLKNFEERREEKCSENSSESEIQVLAIIFLCSQKVIPSCEFVILQKKEQKSSSYPHGRVQCEVYSSFFNFFHASVQNQNSTLLLLCSNKESWARWIEMKFSDSCQSFIVFQAEIQLAWEYLKPVKVEVDISPSFSFVYVRTRVNGRVGLAEKHTAQRQWNCSGSSSRVVSTDVSAHPSQFFHV